VQIHVVVRLKNLPQVNDMSTASQEIRKRGFDLYCTDGTVRRLSPNLSAVKTGLEGYWIVELKDGKWSCDCLTAKTEDFCEHIYAAQLAKKANRSFQEELEPIDEASLKCKYCGSPDIKKCGFRYNTRGISRIYFCNECERKISIRMVRSEQAVANIPPEVVWLLDEVGLQVAKLNQLLTQLDSKLTEVRGTRNPDDA
jgi:hypothetical protein